MLNATHSGTKKIESLSEDIAALKLQLQAKDKALADQQKEIQELACLKHVVSFQKNKI